MPDIPITRNPAPIDQRLTITAQFFGIHFPRQLEPAIYNITSRLAPAYNGGFWCYWSLRVPVAITNRIGLPLIQ